VMVKSTSEDPTEKITKVTHVGAGDSPAQVLSRSRN
jgi:hypothetical protein